MVLRMVQLDTKTPQLGNFSAAEDKQRYAYILTPKGIAEKAAITKHFLMRKIGRICSLEDRERDLAQRDER